MPWPGFEPGLLRANRHLVCGANFPALWEGVTGDSWILIGSFNCLSLLWLVEVITLVLVLRPSFENDPSRGFSLTQKIPEGKSKMCVVKFENKKASVKRVSCVSDVLTWSSTLFSPAPQVYRKWVCKHRWIHTPFPLDSLSQLYQHPLVSAQKLSFVSLYYIILRITTKNKLTQNFFTIAMPRVVNTYQV